jgi:hypothetical protein
MGWTCPYGHSQFEQLSDWIKDKESFMPLVLCSEGHVVDAGATDGIDFGGVTSCMTITCLLADGSKVAAHDAIFQRVQPQIFTALKGQIAGRAVSKVITAGAGSMWTPRMTSQTQLSNEFAKNDSTWASRSWDKQLAQMEPFLISSNPEHFRQILAWQFGVELASVSYTKYDEGRIQISPNGTLQTG